MYETFAEKMSEDKVDSTDKVDIIDYDSEDNKDEYEDASEGPNDFVKPSEWESKSENKNPTITHFPKILSKTTIKVSSAEQMPSGTFLWVCPSNSP